MIRMAAEAKGGNVAVLGRAVAEEAQDIAPKAGQASKEWDAIRTGRGLLGRFTWRCVGCAPLIVCSATIAAPRSQVSENVPFQCAVKGKAHRRKKQAKDTSVL